MNPNQKMSWTINSQHTTYENAASAAAALRDAGLTVKIHMMGPYNKKFFAVKIGKSVEKVEEKKE